MFLSIKLLSHDSQPKVTPPNYHLPQATKAPSSISLFCLLSSSYCLLLRRFDSEAGEAGELEARETGDEHARDHGKEKDERRNACKNSCRFLANFVVFLARYFSRVFKP